MSTPSSGALVSPAQLAKGALRRLAQAQLEPTPAHYARAYADEAGAPLPPEGSLPAHAKPQIERLVMRVTDDPSLRGELAGALMDARFDDLQRALDRSAEAAAAHAGSWAQVIDRLARGLERGARHWTGARKKDSLQRVLDRSRSDAQRLQQRLGQLINAWEADQPDADVDAVDSALAPLAPTVDARLPAPAPQATLAEFAELATLAPSAPSAPSVQMAAAPPATPAATATPPNEHPRIVDALQATVRAGLPTGEPRAVELADTLAALASRISSEGASAELAAAVALVCQRARCLLGLRHELVDELMALCQSLTQGLADESEAAQDSNPVAVAASHLQERLDGSHSARAVRAARHLLDDTRTRQRALRSERLLARDAIKQLVREVLQELGGLAGATGQFNDKLSACLQGIESADSLASLADVVRELAGESRTVHALVAGARDRMAAEHARASALQSRVQALEDELRRVHGELTTDVLTQVANRRGLALAFDREKARAERAAEAAAANPANPAAVAPLAVGLIDIDNFKKLNDSLGHAAGDVALQTLALRVKEWLRPVDCVARFGGEEFVLLLPATMLDDASAVLTRLQRQLSASLFMHLGREVFVTFSAGVTAWRPGETMEAALGRADEGLYEAKQAGKNRTCVA